MFKILTIDDDPDIIDYIRQVMPAEDYTISSAGGSIEAQNKISRQKFDAILLDIGLPGDDGISLLKFLNSIGVTRNTPVIMITATASRKNVIACRENGAMGFLMKPLKKKTLLDQVSRSISMRDMQVQVTPDKENLSKLRIEQDPLYTMLVFEDKIDFLSLKKAFLAMESAQEKNQPWGTVVIDVRTQPSIKQEQKIILRMLVGLLNTSKNFILAGHNFGELISQFPETVATLVISEIDLRQLMRQQNKE